MEVNLLQEEVTKLKEVKERSDKLVIDLGEVAIQKARLELVEESLKQELKKVVEAEQSISEELVAKYGAVSVDLEKGVAYKLS